MHRARPTGFQLTIILHCVILLGFMPRSLRIVLNQRERERERERGGRGGRDVGAQEII